MTMTDLEQFFPTMSVEKYKKIFEPILQDIVDFMGFKIDKVNNHIYTKSTKLVAPHKIYFPWVNLRQYYALVSLLSEEQVLAILKALTDDQVDKLTPAKIMKISPFHICMGISKAQRQSTKPYLEYLEDLGLIIDRKYNKVVDDFKTKPGG